MPELIKFSDSNNTYESKCFINKMAVQAQINKASMILTKFQNIVNLLMNNMSNFHSDYAKTLYTILDNLSVALRTEKDLVVSRSSISTRFVPFIYKYPCQDGIIARIFEISNHLHNLFFIFNEIGVSSPILLDHLSHIFNKFEMSLEELQSFIQRTSLMKCKDDAILQSVLFSDDEEVDDSDEEDEADQSNSTNI